MELVAGIDFLRYVRTHSGPDETRLRSALDQLARVLIWLHERSVLHRDIKPENIILTESARLVLLDFGLARLAPSDGGTGPVLAGTPAYMAPEQLSDAPITAAVDWYAAGTLLYQALADRLPFEGRAMHVLRSKCSADPPALPEIPAIARGWAELCRGLLTRDAAERATGGDILLFLGSGNAPGGYVAHPAGIVGRADIFRRLKEACAAALAGAQCSVIDFRGPSGFGKSTILREFSEIGSRHVPRCAGPSGQVLRARVGTLQRR